MVRGAQGHARPLAPPRGHGARVGARRLAAHRRSGAPQRRPAVHQGTDQGHHRHVDRRKGLPGRSRTGHRRRPAVRTDDGDRRAAPVHRRRRGAEPLPARSGGQSAGARRRAGGRLGLGSGWRARAGADRARSRAFPGLRDAAQGLADARERPTIESALAKEIAGLYAKRRGRDAIGSPRRPSSRARPGPRLISSSTRSGP